MGNANVLLGMGMAVFGIIWLIMLAFGILILIAQWHIFKKAGQHGWAAIVPGYNVYVLTKIVWGNGWLFLLLLIPVGNIVFAICTYVKLARSFGKSGGFAAGLVLLPYVFMPMLGFGKAEYEGPSQSGKKGMIIGSAITGVVGTILLVIVTVIAAMSVQSVPDYEDYDYNASADLSDPEDALSEEDLTDDSTADTSSDTAPAVTGEPIEGYDNFIMATLDNGDITVTFPLLNSETHSYGEGAMLTAEANGISIELAIGYGESSDPAAEVSDDAKVAMSVFEDLSNFYKDVTISDMITGDGFALQQIDYNYQGFDGELYPCIELIKCDIVNGYPITINMTLDNYTADENTKALFASACELYGIDFEFAE